MNSPSIGDLMVGTSRTSSIIGLDYAFFALLFFSDWIYFKQDKQSRHFFFLSIIFALLTGYMASVTIFVLSIASFFLISETINIFLKQRFKKIILIGILSIVIFGAASYKAARNYFFYYEAILTKFEQVVVPIKFLAIKETVCNFAVNNPVSGILGVGFGNYSSRAAFITGGVLLTHHPDYIPITSSPYFLTYIKPLWEYRLSHHTMGIWNYKSIVQMPWCEFQTLFAEGGLISFIIFLSIIVFTGKKMMANGKVDYALPLLYLFLMLLVDNWMEIPAYALLYWLLMHIALNPSPENCGTT